MPALAPLLPPDKVVSRAFLPGWFALAFAGGAVNATALAACRRFVSHVTGSLTHLAMDYASMRLVFDYGAVLASFVVGAMASAWFIEGRRRRGKQPFVMLPFALVSATLVLAGVCGQLGVFGAFGTTVETNADFVLLGLLAFAMGLQNATVTNISGMMVRTTHMTGPLTDFSMALGAFFATPEVRDEVRGVLRLRALKITGFVAGAFVAAVVARQAEYAAFVLPAAVVTGSGLWLTAALKPRDERASDPKLTHEAEGAPSSASF